MSKSHIKPIDKSLRATRLKAAWAVDYDYIHLLSEEELQFLADFTNFYYHGSPNKCKSIDMSKELRAESYKLNNERERDIFHRINRKQDRNILSNDMTNVTYDYVINNHEVIYGKRNKKAKTL